MGYAPFFMHARRSPRRFVRRGNDVGDMADSQIKSRERVRAHGEVFTANGQKAQKGWDDKASEILFVLGL